MKNILKNFKFAAAPFALFALASCTMEPDYVRPETPLDAKVEKLTGFKYAEGLWKEAEPADNLPKGKWWEIFQDEELNKLILACREKSPNLKAAFYIVEQARQKARIDEADLYPNVDGNASFSRTGTSKNEVSSRGTFDDYRVGVGLTWDLDFFGRVQALVKSDSALAEAQYSAYQGVMLMLESEVAINYFSICQYNSELALLENTIAVRKEQLKRVEDEVRVRSKDNLDLGRAQQLYYEALSQRAGVSRARDYTISYLAYICGTTPNAQNIPDKLLSGKLPDTPKVVPSTLLERRPDIAEMERQVYAANFRIGSATSAFFPTIQITSSLDLASADIGDLLNSSSLAWGVSPRLYVPIFQAGRLIAQREIAISSHAQLVEQYKDKVLFAIFEVENALSQIKGLKDEYEARFQVAKAAKEVETLTKKKLDIGEVNYFEYSDAERLSLANERECIRLLGDQYKAIINLVKAVGGTAKEDSQEIRVFSD